MYLSHMSCVHSGGLKIMLQSGTKFHHCVGVYITSHSRSPTFLYDHNNSQHGYSIQDGIGRLLQMIWRVSMGSPFQLALPPPKGQWKAMDKQHNIGPLLSHLCLTCSIQPDLGKLYSFMPIPLNPKQFFFGFFMTQILFKPWQPSSRQLDKFSRRHKIVLTNIFPVLNPQVYKLN